MAGRSSDFRQSTPMRGPDGGGGFLRRRWDRLGLGGKLRLLIQAVLLIVLVAAQLWVMERFRLQILGAAEERAQTTADDVINGMNMLMVTGQISFPENRTLYIRKMAASEGVRELRIIRAKQVQDQFGPGLPQEQAQDELDRAAIALAKPLFRLDTHAADPTLRAVVPFVVSTDFRGTNCLQCHHVQVGSVNGAASITLGLSGDFAKIADIERTLWAGQIALQWILFVLIGWFTRRLIEPLQRLETAMSNLRGDELLQGRPEDLQVPVRSQDEIGRLTQAFNGMAQLLRREIAENRRTAEQLAFRAEHDPLTGLYNRRRFWEDLARGLAAADRHGTTVGLLLFDLDGFKRANDRHGHDAGDAILAGIAAETVAGLRRNETLYRIGGDEFTIIAVEVSLEGMEVLAQRVIEVGARTIFNFSGESVHITASIGIALYPRDARNARDLVSEADAAMYRAKKSGGNGWRICELQPV